MEHVSDLCLGAGGQVPVVPRRLDHHLVSAIPAHRQEPVRLPALWRLVDAQGRELVRHHPHPPSALRRLQPPELRRGPMLPARAERAGPVRSPPGSPGPLARTEAPLRGDDHPVPGGRVLPKLGHRSRRKSRAFTATRCASSGSGSPIGARRWVGTNLPAQCMPHPSTHRASSVREASEAGPWTPWTTWSVLPSPSTLPHPFTAAASVDVPARRLGPTPSTDGVETAASSRCKYHASLSRARGPGLTGSSRGLHLLPTPGAHARR
jgi:hypothetical protein